MRYFLFMLLLQPAFLFAQHYTVTVVVEGVKDDEGEIGVGFYSASEQFPDDPARVLRIDKSSGGPTYTGTFTDVPPGDYAVTLLDDRNGNFEMDTNFFGYPQEGFGFSNNVKPSILGAPPYARCVFSVKRGTSITITMLYY